MDTTGSGHAALQKTGTYRAANAPLVSCSFTHHNSPQGLLSLSRRAEKLHTSDAVSCSVASFLLEVGVSSFCVQIVHADA